MFFYQKVKQKIIGFKKLGIILKEELNEEANKNKIFQYFFDYLNFKNIELQILIFNTIYPYLNSFNYSEKNYDTIILFIINNYDNHHFEKNIEQVIDLEIEKNGWKPFLINITKRNKKKELVIKKINLLLAIIQNNDNINYSNDSIIFVIDFLLSIIREDKIKEAKIIIKITEVLLLFKDFITNNIEIMKPFLKISEIMIKIKIEDIEFYNLLTKSSAKVSDNSINNNFKKSIVKTNSLIKPCDSNSNNNTNISISEFGNNSNKNIKIAAKNNEYKANKGNKDSENLEELILNSDNDTRLAILQGLESQINKCVSPVNSKKNNKNIITKIIKIITSIMEVNITIDQNIIDAAFKLFTIIINNIALSNIQLNTIYDMVFNIILNKDAKINDKVVIFLLELKNYYYLKYFVKYINIDFEYCDRILIVFTSMIIEARKNSKYINFLKEIGNYIGELVESFQELVNHNEANTRKLTILCITEFYFFLSYDSFKEIINHFSDDKINLINIYINKKKSK